MNLDKALKKREKRLDCQTFEFMKMHSYWAKQIDFWNEKKVLI